VNLFQPLSFPYPHTHTHTHTPTHTHTHTHTHTCTHTHIPPHTHTPTHTHTDTQTHTHTHTHTHTQTHTLPNPHSCSGSPITPSCTSHGIILCPSDLPDGLRGVFYKNLVQFLLSREPLKGKYVSVITFFLVFEVEPLVKYWNHWGTTNMSSSLVKPLMSIQVHCKQSGWSGFDPTPFHDGVNPSSVQDCRKP